MGAEFVVADLGELRRLGLFQDSDYASMIIGTSMGQETVTAISVA